MEVSNEMKNFFNKFENIDDVGKNINKNKNGNSVENMERSCSRINQVLADVRKDLIEISENTSEIHDVSAACQYNATRTIVSLKNITETQTKPTYFEFILGKINSLFLMISNVAFALSE